MTLFSLNGFGQYTYTTNHVIDGGNPGGLNTDADNSNTGWTQLITGPQTTNSWSASYALPFAFDFYGSPVTDAIISGNGVLSFTTTATAIPADANTSLPATGTSNIPDNSILGFWDSFTAGAPTGSGDNVLYKVFGTAPNRQVWFRYHSYEYGDNGSGGAQSSYTYWAIALEETTNKVYIIDMNYAPGGPGLTSTVGVQQNSTTAVEVGSGSVGMGAGTSSANATNDYYEFTPVLLVNDNAAITAVTAPVSPLTTGMQNVDVTLENAGLNALTSATINWRVNGVLQTANNWTGSLAANGGSATVSLGMYNFLAGNSTIEAWTSVPNGNTDGDTSNDSISVTLCTSLTGSYDIGGATPDYTDIAAAVADLNSCGVSGPVTFNIAAGTYTGAAMIGNVTGSSAINTITFNGAGTATTIMTYDGSGTENATMTLNGTDYVTIKNLTIENTESSSNGWGIHLTNTADYNTIDSCSITVNAASTSSSYVGVLCSGSLTSISTTGNNGNYNTVSNSTVNGGYYGVRFYGNSSATPDNISNKVENCTFANTYLYPVYFYYQDSPEAHGNTVPSFRSTSGGYGIYMNYAKHPVITKNSVHGCRTYGLYLANSNTSTQGSNQRGLIANNMVSSLGTGEGIYLTAADSIDIWHNSVSAENENALWLSSTADEYNVRNNVFVTSNGPEVVELDASPSATDVIDYNVYYHSGAGVLVDISGTDYADIPAWIAADPANNANSIYGDPTFLGATDLHLGGTVANDVGVVIASITDDIDGDSRSASTPDIGADEYVPPTCFQPSAQSATNITATSADLGWTPSGTETMWDYEYGMSGFTQGTGTLVTGTTSNPSNITSLTPNTTYQFYVRANCGASVTSTWAGPFSFTTACVAFTAPYTESFDIQGTPSCWSQYNISGGPWEFSQGSGVNTACGTPSEHTGNGGYFAWMDQSSTDDSVCLEMNDVDVSALTTAYLEFYYSECAGSNMTAQNFLYVEAWDGTMWNNVGTINQSTNGWEVFGFDISGHTYGANLVRIRFRAESGGASFDYEGDNLIDDVSIVEAPTCFLPTSLNITNLTSSSADLGWTANTGEAAWDIEWGAAGFTPGTGTLISNTGSNPYNLSSLTSISSYDFYVRAICGPGDSSLWAGPLSFTTLCGNYTPTYTEDFTNYLPTCWEEFQGVLGATNTTITNTTTSNWDFEVFGNAGSNDAAYINLYSTGRDEWLMSPSIDLGAGGTDYLLSFDVAVTDYNNTSVGPLGPDDTLAVVISTDNGVTWNTGNILRMWGMGTEPSNTGDYVGINLAGYTGVVKFGFYAASSVSNADNDIFIDNFSVSPCIASTNTVSLTVCDSYTTTSGTVYTTSGTINDTLVNAIGCDSILTINLTVNSSSTSTDVQVACGAYTWIDGNTYTANNNSATFLLTNAAGCDSTVTLDLTINNAATGTDVQVACDSYTWIDGNTYTASNSTATFTVVGGAANGCDSIVTLDLTLNNSSTGIDIISSCGSYTWIDGITYNSSNNTATHTLVNAAGCDSVVSLYLTVNQPSTSTSTHVACGSYTWIDGNTYTSSNTTATYTLVNAAGCDSIITLNLTINMPTANTITAVECDSYTSGAGNTYTSSGTYTEVLMGANGCDSVLTINLTINAPDLSVSQSSGIYLNSNQANATYQWLDCSNGNTPIPGETDQIFAATTNGDYAVEVTFQTCVGTSECITVNSVGIEDVANTFATVFPNPVSDLLTITLSDLDNAQFELMDVQGKIVISSTTIANGEQVDVSNLESGIYFVRLISDNNRMVKRIVKH